MFASVGIDFLDLLLLLLGLVILNHHLESGDLSNSIKTFKILCKTLFID